MALVALPGACRSRPDVRVLADERARVALDEAIALYEMRTGQHVRVAYVSRGRMEAMLLSGRDDLVVCETAQAVARSTSAGLDAATAHELGALPGGTTLTAVLRLRVREAEAPRSLWAFLRDEEARRIYEAAGWRVGDAAAPPR